MTRLSLFLLLAAGCGSRALPGGDDGGPADAMADLTTDDAIHPIDAGGCPATDPPFGQCKSEGLTCFYAKERCKCSMGYWYCVDKACPVDENPSGPCKSPGVFCPYGFEHVCSCTAHGWLCCGGVPNMCPWQRPVEGEVCGCGVGMQNGGVCPVGSCIEGTAANCRCVDNGWQCTPGACFDGGVTDL
jgi:hypothetical protein